MTHAPCARDFPRAVRTALTRRGITLLRPTALGPDYCNPQRGYEINDNDCGRVVTFADVYLLAGVDEAWVRALPHTAGIA